MGSFFMAANLPRPSSTENVSSTLSSGITDSATTVSIADASNLVAPCYLVIDRVDSSGTLKATSFWEYIKVTNIAGNDLTVTRGQNGSTQQSHSSGAVIEAVVTSAMFEDWYTALNPEHTAVGGHVMGTATVNYTETFNLAVPSIASIAQLNVTNLTIPRLVNTSLASIARGEFSVIALQSVASSAIPEFGIQNANGNLIIRPGASKLVAFSTLHQDDTTNAYKTNSVILKGWGVKTGTSAKRMSEVVSFGISFATTPIVTASLNGAGANPGVAADNADGNDAGLVMPSLVTNTQFTAQMVNTDTNGTWPNTRGYVYSWTAIGEL